VAGVRSVVIAIIGRLLGQNVGLEGPRHNNGHAQTEGCDLLGQRFSPSFQRALRRGIRADHRHAADAALTRHDNNPPASRSAHRRQERFGEPYRTEQVRAEHLLPNFEWHILGATCGGDSSVVHKDIGRAQSVLNLIGSCADRLGIVEVESNGEKSRIIVTGSRSISQPFQARLR
jgi:hypothetical protein